MQNVLGLQDSALTIFGGLVAELNAPDIPAGSSPLCCDCDFTVGSAKTRFGIESVYQFQGFSTGPDGCQSGTAPAQGTQPWANPGNITLHDGNYASVSVDTALAPTANSGSAANSGTGTAWSNPANAFSSSVFATLLTTGTLPKQSLQLTNLGFAIPSGATITGLQISFQASVSSGSVNLDGGPVGLQGGGGFLVTVNSATPSNFTQGGNNNLFGDSPVTPALINASAFGFQFFLSSIGTGTLSLNTVVVTVFYTTDPFSDFLLAEQFGFNLSNLPIAGVEIGITGHQIGTQSGANPVVTVFLLKAGLPVGVSKQINLTTTDSRIVLGSPTDLWGTTWLNSDLNANNFGVRIQAANLLPASVFIDFVDCTVFQTPGSFNFSWVKTEDLEQFGGSLLTLALDSTGTLWKEDVIANQGLLTSFYTGIAPNSFVSSVTEDGREYMAFSDLTNPTDMPRQYDATNLDRISQVGPAAPPAIATEGTSYSVVASPNGVTQPAAVTVRRAFWSAAAGTNSSAGNVITVFAGSIANIQIGSVVFLAGLPTMNSQNPNGTYLVTSTGFGQVNGSGGTSNFFSVVSTISNLSQTNDNLAGATYQITLATVNTTTPVPNVQVGSQITLSGVTVTGWNASWTVLATPNAAQLTITNTALSANVATYNYTLVTGSAPSAGQKVTISNTTNGNGIFNVVNGIIQSATGTQFTIDINAPNVTSAAETGFGLINGTAFQFDPGIADVGTGTNPILGNSGGGTLAPAGTLGAGTRQCVLLFETRNGLIPAPSPPVTFTTSGSASKLVVSNILVGPPNVIRRILAFTGAGGANFFWIPQPVTVTSNGQKIVYNATVVPDNSTTTISLAFTDAVLLAANAIDIPGNNLFAQIELGNSVGVIAYSERLLFWGEQNKVQNFINLSFDGGYLPNVSGVNVPAGWTIDPTNGGGVQLRASPLFGDSYYVLNSLGATQTTYGMIEQSAFQDVYGVPIINQNTTYGVRVTCRCPSGVNSSGALNVDLFSPSLNQTFGIFTLALSAMTSTMKIFTGNLLTTAILGAIPSDLLLRVYETSLLNTSDVEIDRLEVYPLLQPVLSTQMRASYANNFEAFDGITGNLGVASENQQPITCAFTLFDNLYVVKTKSFYSTSDNGITEPNFWQVREISKKVGTASPNGVDVGEGWALIAGEPGVYLFEGGVPVKILPEIDPLWKTINWKAGNTLWIRNDTNQRKLYIGVPIPTPNQWMPTFPTNATPTSPNVVLMMNYKELMTAEAIESEGPVRLTFMGDLRTYQLGRKWSAWSIQAGYADFVIRLDTTSPLFFCGDTGKGKIYQQISGNFLDDGAPQNCVYVTYPFPKTQEAQALGFGLHELQASFMTLLLNGSGNVNITIFPDSLNSPFADALPSVALGDPPSFGDTEVPLNELGNRFFVQLTPVNPGDWFEISRAVLTLQQAPWSPVRGSN